MESELVHLVSKGCGTTISTNWTELREESDFVDVTLACAGIVVKAHKVILSACSPVLKELFIQTQHPHPVIYLRGVKHSQINALLDFIYKGEVNIARDELDDFLDVANELKIKGLLFNEDDMESKDCTVNKENLEYNKKNDNPHMKSSFSETPLPNYQNSFNAANDTLSIGENNDRSHCEINTELHENVEDLIKDESQYHESEDVGRPPFDYNEDVSNESNLKAAKSSSNYEICQFCAKKVSKKSNAYKTHLEVVHGHAHLVSTLAEIYKRGQENRNANAIYNHLHVYNEI